MQSEQLLTPSQHLFSKLPPELRLRIWSLNLPTSRLIPVNCLTDLSSRAASSTKASPGCTSAAPIPSNLHACSESRAHALDTRYEHSLSFARSPPALLLDPRADVLYFPRLDGFMASASNFHAAVTLCAPADLSAVERLALHGDVFGTGTGEADDAFYWSGLAIERTVEVLGLVRERLAGVGEIVFVSRRGSHRVTRLEEQIACAIRDMDWKDCPPWSVMEEP